MLVKGLKSELSHDVLSEKLFFSTFVGTCVCHIRLLRSCVYVGVCGSSAHVLNVNLPHLFCFQSDLMKFDLM